MRPTITSYNGHAINDGTNYNAGFDKGSFFPQASSQAIELVRSDNAPVISSIKRTSKLMKINIYPLGVFTTQINVLNGWFDTFDKNLHQLIVTDENSVQWYVNARVEGEPIADVGLVTYSLRIPDPVWQMVTPIVDAWSITATGQQHTITTVGNRSVYPSFAIKPTSAKVGGFAYTEYRAWYNPQTTFGLKDEILDVANAAWNTANLVADTTVSNQINQGGGVNNSVTTFPVDTAVGGGLPATGGTFYIGTEQCSYTTNSGTSITGIVRNINGTSAASHADNAVLTFSRTAADGSDFRLKIQGQGAATDWPFWLYGYNGASTKIQTVIDFDPGITLVLKTALDDHTATTTLTFAVTKATKAALKILAQKKNFMFVIGSEVFTFNTGTVIDQVNCTISTTATDARGAYGSTKAAHAAVANVFWLQYIFQFCYGNPSLTAAFATQDNSKQPVIDISTSTNTSWVWGTNFSAVTGLRAGSWIPLVVKSPGKQSVTYTGAHAAGADTTPDSTLADPSTAMGMMIEAYQQGTTWRGEASVLQWTRYNGAGFITFTLADLLYRYSTDFPGFVGLQKSVDGIAWSKCTGFPEAKPAGAQSWTAGATHSAVALGSTYRYLRWTIIGSIAGNIANNLAAAEITSMTLARDSAKVPQLAYTGAGAGAYQLQCTITNVGTGDYITLDFTMATNDTLTVDCLNKNATSPTGANAIGCLTPNAKRNYWLTIEPPTANGGVTNGGKLQFDDTGTAGVTVTSTYPDRIA